MKTIIDKQYSKFINVQFVSKLKSAEFGLEMLKKVKNIDYSGKHNKNNRISIDIPDEITLEQSDATEQQQTVDPFIKYLEDVDDETVKELESLVQFRLIREILFMLQTEKLTSEEQISIYLQVEMILNTKKTISSLYNQFLKLKMSMKIYTQFNSNK